MSDIEIILDEKNTLEFEVEIQGISTKGIQPRFIVNGGQMDFSFDGKYDNGTVIVDIPILSTAIEPDTYKCSLEFIVDGHYFEPVQLDIDFILPTKITAGIKNTSINSTKKVDAGKINIDTTAVSVKHEAPEPDPIVIEDESDTLKMIENIKQELIKINNEDEMKRSIEAFNKEIESKEGRQFEVKNMPVEIKEINEDGTFSGYGSVFGVKDSYNDIVEKGAFTKTLNERKNVKLLWQHDQREPIGIFTKMYEDDNGLVVEGKIAMDVQRGKEAHTLIKMGAVDGLSIGYSTITSKFDKKSNIRFLKELKLYEVSIVTFPANEAATVTSMKTENTQMINNNIKSLQSQHEPIDHSDNEPVENHSKSVEADDNSDAITALEQLVESLKTKKENNNV